MITLTVCQFIERLEDGCAIRSNLLRVPRVDPYIFLKSIVELDAPAFQWFPITPRWHADKQGTGRSSIIILLTVSALKVWGNALTNQNMARYCCADRDRVVKSTLVLEGRPTTLDQIKDHHSPRSNKQQVDKLTAEAANSAQQP
jgi:hypothetical protein